MTGALQLMATTTGADGAGGQTPLLTEQAADLTGTWNTFVVAAAVVGGFVALLIAWVIIRYRRRGSGDDASSMPGQKQYNNTIEVLYTAVPLAIVVGLFAITWQSINRVEALSDSPDVVIDVTAYQWQWQFDYADRGARSAAIGDEPPELVLPANSTVRFQMTSRDVIHSFWIPGFRYKRDIFPNETTEFQVDVTDEVGRYPNSGICAEFCGLDHHKMRFDLRIVDQADFDAWIAEHQVADTDGGDSTSNDTTGDSSS